MAKAYKMRGKPMVSCGEMGSNSEMPRKSGSKGPVKVTGSPMMIHREPRTHDKIGISKKPAKKPTNRGR